MIADAIRVPFIIFVCCGAIRWNRFSNTAIIWLFFFNFSPMVATTTKRYPMKSGNSAGALEPNSKATALPDKPLKIGTNFACTWCESIANSIQSWTLNFPLVRHNGCWKVRRDNPLPLCSWCYAGIGGESDTRVCAIFVFAANVFGIDIRYIVRFGWVVMWKKRTFSVSKADDRWNEMGAKGVFCALLLSWVLGCVLALKLPLPTNNMNVINENWLWALGSTIEPTSTYVTHPTNGWADSEIRFPLYTCLWFKRLRCYR